MSIFVDLASRWLNLMSIKTTPQPCPQIHESHVLDLTSKYIKKLGTIQDGFKLQAAAFRAKLREDFSSMEHIDEVCLRFLAGVGITLRREIPPNVPRSIRVRARRLVINWKSDVITASWNGVGDEFPLRESLLFCAKHSGGACETIESELVDQLLHDLQNGSASVPGLKLITHDIHQSILEWESAVLNLPSEPMPTSAILPWCSDELERALSACIEDTRHGFYNEIEKCITEKHQEYDEIKLNAFRIAYRVPSNDDVGTDFKKAVEEFAIQISKYDKGNHQWTRNIAMSALSGVEAAIAQDTPLIASRRAAVFRRFEQTMFCPS